MKSFRTSPSSSAAVPRALALDASPFDRHHLWLAAGALLAFLGAALTTVALVERRDAPRPRAVWVVQHHHQPAFVLEVGPPAGGVVVHAVPRLVRW